MITENLNAINQPIANEINFAGDRYLYFGGTAYLGIPQNQDFIDLYLSGIKKFGLNNGTSRSNNVQLGIYNEAEEAAAKRFGSEAALITSSGYLAAQLTVKALSGFGQVIYSPIAHPALWLTEKPDLPSYTFTEWASQTINHINSSARQNWVLISNSMNNLFPEIFDFGFIELIDANKNVILIVDDSHGIGINNNGFGAFSSIPATPNVEVVVVASMAKALGIDAGIVLATRSIINQLKNTHIFNGASPAAAAGAYAFIHAEAIYKNALEKLQHNIASLNRNLGKKWKFVTGFPAFLIDDPNISKVLKKEHVLISSFPYPDQNGEPIHRIVLSSWHTDENMNKLITTLDKHHLIL